MTSPSNFEEFDYVIHYISLSPLFEMQGSTYYPPPWGGGKSLIVGQVKEDLFLAGSDLGWMLSVAVQRHFFPFSHLEILHQAKKKQRIYNFYIHIYFSNEKLKTNQVSERNVSINEKPQE